MLSLAFALAIIAFILQTILFPSFILLAFSPWIALVVLKCSFHRCMIYAMISGSILDLFSNDPMGVHALNYTLIALTLYRYKRFFSYEMPLHLGLFTFLVSFTSTLLQIFLLFLFDRRIPFAGEWVFGDLVIMPLADALYAIIWLSYPLKFFEQGRPFWHKLKKRIFPTTL